ncbi:MAG TPA: hypothetical protein VK668_05760 [Mucilaginibacter sp.]|nr:hypothetical protein [Mucilaginibacter sp.]
MELKLHRSSLFLAPLFYTISGFFWLNGGQYSVTCGTFVVIGSFFWVFAFDGLFGLLKEKAPIYAAWGKAIAIYGAVCGGVAFGLQGIFAEMFSIDHKTMLQALAQHPVAANLIFWFGGPAFPLSILVLGIMLCVKKAVPLWTGILLAAGGLLFPVSRILRIESIGHVVDVLMLIPVWYIAVVVLRKPVGRDMQCYKSSLN